MIARIATFEGGNAEEMSRLNNEILVDRPSDLPAGIARVMVLMKDETRWTVITFFDDAETAASAEKQWEELGDKIPEEIRGKRVSVERCEVVLDLEAVR